MKRLTALCLLLAAGAAGAQTVTLQGMLGSKALLVVDGGAPKAVGAGPRAARISCWATASWGTSR